jgi:hypothetical protein
MLLIKIQAEWCEYYLSLRIITLSSVSNKIDVLSFPVGIGSNLLAITKNLFINQSIIIFDYDYLYQLGISIRYINESTYLVTLVVDDSIPELTICKLFCSPAVRLATQATLSLSSSATICAPFAVELTDSKDASGTFVVSHSLHCSNPWLCDTTLFIIRTFPI